ncbi:hypothetical protein [Microcoleus sp. D3_18a_C4]|uniref:hypothetical protein n=1 Tax=unclassified Microcoleus TaxID=2642155 RepID=UPI002FD6A471
MVKLQNCLISGRTFRAIELWAGETWADDRYLGGRSISGQVRKGATIVFLS